MTSQCHCFWHYLHSGTFREGKTHVLGNLTICMKQLYDVSKHSNLRYCVCHTNVGYCGVYKTLLKIFFFELHQFISHTVTNYNLYPTFLLDHRTIMHIYQPDILQIDVNELLQMCVCHA